MAGDPFFAVNEGGGGSVSALAGEKKGPAVRPDSGKVGIPRSRPSSAQEPRRL